MADNFEDTVFGFDLNYLHQTDYNLPQSRIDKQRIAILKVKKKIICTDSLIKKYHEKQQLLEQMEKDFRAAKEESKQICIDYQNCLDKCSTLEMEVKNTQTIRQDLENKLRMAENQQEGSQAHSNQLQMLVKDYETRLEALKIEMQLEKNNARENDKKKIAGLTKSKELMKKRIHMILDLALNKNKLSSKDKMLLNRYKKIYKCAESSQEVESNEDETDTFEAYDCNENTKFSINAKEHAPTDKHLLKIDDIDRESNGSNNEVVSIDTGRGSSLAFSDSDKSFHSPEYVSDNSPIEVEALNNKDKKTFANKATSPMKIRNNNAALSPIKELQILETCEKQTTCVTRNEIAKSPIQFVRIDVLNENNREKDYLDSNSNRHVSDDENSDDCEIETILSSMRFNKNLITPLPVTPSKSRKRITSINEHSEHITCLEAAKVREEYANLAKEVMSIKSMLKLQLMTGDSDSSQSKVHNSSCTQNIHKNESESLVIETEKSLFDPHSDTESQCSIASLATIVNEFTPATYDVSLPATYDVSLPATYDVSLPATYDVSLIINENTEDDQETNESSKLIAIDDTVPINVSRNLLFEEDPKKIEVSNNLQIGNNLNVNHNTLPQVGTNNIRKLTRLQRLRVKMIPKGKIPRARTLPQRKLLRKPKHIRKSNKEISKTDSSATLNDKEIYEKAVKIMAELKSKNIEKESKISFKKANNEIASIKKHSRKENNNIMERGSSKEQKSLKFDKTNIIHCSDTTSPTSSPASKINTRSRNKHVDIESVILNTQDDDRNKVNSMKISNKNATLKNVRNQETRENRKFKRSSCSEREIENKDNSIKGTENNSNCVNHETQEKNHLSPKNCRTQETRGKRRCLRSSFSEREIESNVNSVHETDKNSTSKNCVNDETQKRKSLKRPSLDEPEKETKRVLRSSSVHLDKSNDLCSLVNGTKQWDETNKTLLCSTSVHLDKSKDSYSLINDTKPCREAQCKNSHELDVSSRIADYSDLNIFTDEPPVQSSDKIHDGKETQDSEKKPQESVLCAMLEKYGVASVRSCNKKISETVINSTCKQIQDGIEKIIELPLSETKSAMNSLVESLRKCELKHLLMGLMQYLKDPARKAELFNKVHALSVPPMTKSEEVLLYILTNLQGTWPGVNFISCVLDNMEYTLFKLNCTPEFGTIESMSHFYAILCRYIKDKTRLRLFIIDAMYCIQYKAVPLIKQCMEVWMHILPLAHLGIAKSPLVMCVVYLLHFFKCEDRFGRVGEIRNILSQKYFYKFADWNESKILDMFRSSIKELKVDTLEKKMLRLALIVLAKRQGPQWCQNNIIKNLLWPIIDEENTPERVKIFCLSMIGPLLKPYPNKMKVHCEIAMNQLIDLINSSTSPQEQEAIVTSLIYMSKHNHNRVTQVLLSWSPEHVSPQMEAILKGYVREKPLKMWKEQLSRLH